MVLGTPLKRTLSVAKRATRVARDPPFAANARAAGDQAKALASKEVRANAVGSVNAVQVVLAQQPALLRQNAQLSTELVVARGQQAAVAMGGTIGAAPRGIGTPPTAGCLKAVLDAVRHAVDMWKIQAYFRDLKINAVTALGTPGCLAGPALEPYIRGAPMTVAFTGMMAEIRDAVAEGVSDCFADWQNNVMVPGLPWYPAFAAFPGPQAPPMPNIPTPLIACVSSMMPRITTPNPLESAMYGALPDSLKVNDAQQLMRAYAVSLSYAFLTWLPSAMVTNVLGKGPVPSFSPPYVPVGPVVMGDNIAAPGHVAAAPSLNIGAPLLPSGADLAGLGAALAGALMETLSGLAG